MKQRKEESTLGGGGRGDASSSGRGLIGPARLTGVREKCKYFFLRGGRVTPLSIGCMRAVCVPSSVALCNGEISTRDTASLWKRRPSGVILIFFMRVCILQRLSLSITIRMAKRRNAYRLWRRCLAGALCSRIARGEAYLEALMAADESTHVFGLFQALVPALSQFLFALRPHVPYPRKGIAREKGSHAEECSNNSLLGGNI